MFFLGGGGNASAELNTFIFKIYAFARLLDLDRFITLSLKLCRGSDQSITDQPTKNLVVISLKS